MTLRRVLAVLVVTLAACGSETPAPAPTTPGPTPGPVPTPSPTPTPTPTPGVGTCAQDSECVYTDAAVCPACCHCGRVMTAAEQSRIQQQAAVVDCDMPDCSRIRCEPCATVPSRVVCESGTCVGKYDGVRPPQPTPPPDMVLPQS